MSHAPLHLFSNFSSTPAPSLISQLLLLYMLFTFLSRFVPYFFTKWARPLQARLHKDVVDRLDRVLKIVVAHADDDV